MTLPTWGRTASQLAALNQIRDGGTIEIASDSLEARVHNGRDPWNDLDVWIDPDAPGGGDVAWDDVTGKPSTFAPSAHTHVTAEVTGLDAALAGKQPLDAALTATTAAFTTAQETKLSGIATAATANASDAALRDRATHTGTQAVGTITGLATVATTGAYADLSGAPALFDGAYSSLSGVPSTFAPSSHTHVTADVTGLDTALAGKLGIPTLAQSRYAFSDFHGTAAAQNLPFVGAAISAGTSSTAVHLAGGFGVLRIACSATANSGYRWMTVSTLQGADGIFFRGVIGWAGTFAANVVVRMGFHDATTSADAVDGIYLEAVGDQVTLKCANNSARTASATAWTVPAVDTLYAVDIAQVAGFAIIQIRDMSRSLLFSETVSSNLPTGTARVFNAGVIATNSTASNVRNLIVVDFMGIAPGVQVTT